VQILGSTPHPDDAFVVQAFRGLVSAGDVLQAGRVRVIRTPPPAPNCNAHAERFVRSIKTECLDRVVPLGERHFRHLLREFVAHYHAERNR
jgi:hypothetical protein